MAKDLPSFIAQEGAKREGSIIREKNFIDANNYETVAYLKHLDIRNEPKMVLFENVPALNKQKSDFYDITFTKNKYYEPRRMSFSAHKHHHLEAMTCEYEAENKRAPVIVILGHHPAFYLSTCCMTPFGNNDYLTASSFLDEPLRVTPSTTWGDKFLVPADAEVIIEG